jgi:hypothetical protein
LEAGLTIVFKKKSPTSLTIQPITWSFLKIFGLYCTLDLLLLESFTRVFCRQRKVAMKVGMKTRGKEGMTKNRKERMTQRGKEGIKEKGIDRVPEREK